MKSWFIKDQQVIDLLRKNGFTCEHPNPTQTGIIQFYTRTLEDDKNWYDSNCPIEFGEEYTLPDGNILKSYGTSLVLKTSEETLSNLEEQGFPETSPIDWEYVNKRLKEG